MKNILEYKSVHSSDVTIKDIDESKGLITGYFAVFGNVDSDDDMIMPGAFKKTLSENYKRIKHLYQHDPWKPLSGTKDNRLILIEDTIGLRFDSTLSQTSWGKDTIRLYLDGVIDEQSIGFQTIKSNDRDKYKELTELKLWEGSTVTWAANERALTTNVKSIDDVNILSKKMDNVMKSIRNGKYENEEIFDQLEFYFKQLQQNFIDLLRQTDNTPTPPVQYSTVEPDLLNVIKTFNNSLNSTANDSRRIEAAA